MRSSKKCRSLFNDLREGVYKQGNSERNHAGKGVSFLTHKFKTSTIKATTNMANRQMEKLENHFQQMVMLKIGEILLMECKLVKPTWKAF